MSIKFYEKHKVFKLDGKNAHLYASYDDVFKESNNYNNKEALWKHRWFSGTQMCL